MTTLHIDKLRSGEGGEDDFKVVETSPLTRWGDGTSLRVAGRRHPRVEGVAKVTGRARYAYDSVVIAAHASVAMVEVLQAAPYDAGSVVSYSQGSEKDGSPVAAARSNPEAALQFESGHDPTHFYSLGFIGQDPLTGEYFGGEIVVEYDCCITNGEGPDVKVIEDTWGYNYPLEQAKVYASSDGLTWHYLGMADNSNHGDQ